MNKLLKIGLIFQIPNLLALVVLILGLVIFNINWGWMYENAGFIILGVIFSLLNIFSIIFIALGILNENSE